VSRKAHLGRGVIRGDRSEDIHVRDDTQEGVKDSTDRKYILPSKGCQGAKNGNYSVKEHATIIFLILMRPIGRPIWIRRHYVYWCSAHRTWEDFVPFSFLSIA